MSDPISHAPGDSAGASVTTLASQVRSLRLILQGGLAAVLLASIGINVLLYKQLGALKSANAALAPQFESATKIFNEVESKQWEQLINQLRVFAKTDPGYAEVLKKFGLTEPDSSPAP